MMRLYVLGPAFSLPSIDAECTAAIALLHAHSQRTNTPYTLTPTHSTSLRLPYLHDNDSHLHGFQSIATHLTPNPNLTSTQRANSTALCSFLLTRSQPLLDISRYVDYENYTVVRSAFSAILPWYVNYTLPPRLRAAARARTAHFGVDVPDEDVHGEVIDRPGGLDAGVGKEKSFEAETQKRASMLLSGGRNTTVRGLLAAKQGGQAVFTVHALGEEFFETLVEMLGGKSWFLGTKEPTAVDFLAYGVLSAMLYPQLPRDWLRKLLKDKFGGLVAWTEGVHERFGSKTDARAVMELGKCGTEAEVEGMREEKGIALPWAPPINNDIVGAVSAIGKDVISRVPFLAPGTTIITASPRSRKQYAQELIPTLALALVACIGGYGYYAFATGMLVWPSGQESHIFGRRRISDCGHLGAALAGVSLLSRQAQQVAQSEGQRTEGGAVLMEVEVEKNGMP